MSLGPSYIGREVLRVQSGMARLRQRGRANSASCNRPWRDRDSSSSATCPKAQVRTLCPHAKTVLDSPSSAQQNQYNSHGMYGAMSPMYGTNAGPQAYFQGPQNATLGSSDQGKGKGKIKDADFEAAFAQVTESLVSPEVASFVDDELARGLSATTLDDSTAEPSLEFKQ